MQKVLVICGPTATGKTKLAVHLARKFNGELVSADSRQVYKGMDIATGKDKASLGTVPLWMIDVVFPDEEFSVSHYRALAAAAIADIQKGGKLPIIVGGTGFYIHALIHPFETLNVPPNKALRRALNSATVSQLQNKLKALDTKAFARMNASDSVNPRRLIRKIEIAQAAFPRPPHENAYANVLQIGLTAPYEELYRRIDERVDERVAAGVKDEIQMLLAKGYTWDLPSMHTLGYREWSASTSDAEAIRRWKHDEHAYARRQMTWFRGQRGIVWFDIPDGDYIPKVEKAVREWYTR